MNAPAQIFMVFLALQSCVIYVYSTYLRSSDRDAISGTDQTTDQLVLLVLICLDQITNLGFIMDFLLNCIGCDNASSYLFSPLGVADLVSGIPFSMISLAIHGRGTSSWVGVTRILKFLKVARVSRLTRLVRLKRETHGLGGAAGNEEVRAEVLNAAVTLFMIVFVTIDIILILEEEGDEWYIGCDDDSGNCGNHLRWHDALYFTVVTLTTVGYGDIGPSNNRSRLFMVVVILVAFSSVGTLAGNIGAALKRASKWRTWYVLQRDQPHIILAGAPQGYYLKFFAEVFSETQRLPDEPAPTICILSPGPPSEALELLISQLYPALQYIDGSVLRQHDLSRARAECAQAIMVTSDTNARNDNVADDNSILAAISIFRFFQRLHQNSATLMAEEAAAQREAAADEEAERARAELQRKWGDSGNTASVTGMYGAERPRLFSSFAGSRTLQSKLSSKPSLNGSFRDRTAKLFQQRRSDKEFVLPHLCFQVSTRATKDHLLELGMPLNVVAKREFVNALTAIGALLPGFIAFFGNCLRSNPDSETPPSPQSVCILVEFFCYMLCVS